MAIENWSTTAGSNNATPPDGFPEGMAPGSVNDSAREVMAQVRRWAQQAVSSYSAADTGSADTYVIAPAIAPAAYTTRALYWFVAANANTGTSTLNVTGLSGALGAKTIKKPTSGGLAVLASGDIKAGQVVAVVYDGTDMVMVSPVAGLGAAASETVSGIAELATQAETNTGTDDARIVTPLKLTTWTPGVGSVTLDPANDEVLIRDASASNVLKRAALTALAAAQSDQETGSSTTLYVTPGRQHFHLSAAKAFVNIDGTGTIAINAPSYGVTSVTDNGTGDYTVNFSITWADSDFAWGGGAKENSAAANDAILVTENARTTTTLRLHTVNIGNGTASYADADNICLVFYGDL